MHFGRESREKNKEGEEEASRPVGAANSSRPTTESLYSQAGSPEQEEEEGGGGGDCKND